MDLISSFLTPSRTQRPADKSVAQSQESPSSSPSGSFSSSDEESSEEPLRPSASRPKDKQRESSLSRGSDVSEILSSLRSLTDAISRIDTRVAAIEDLKPSKSSRVPSKDFPPNFPSSSLKSIADQERRRKKRRETIYDINKRKLDFNEHPETSSLPQGIPPLFTSSPGLVSLSSNPSTSANTPASTPELSELISRYIAIEASRRLREQELEEKGEDPVSRLRRDLLEKDKNLLMFFEEFVERERTHSSVNKNLGIERFTPQMREDPGFSIWFRRLDQIFEANGYTEQQGIDTLIYYTHPSTRDWMDTLPKNKHNLKTYLLCFARYWNPTKSLEDLKDEFEHRFQEPSERVEKYANVKIGLFNRAYPDQDHELSSEFRNKFVKGLRPSWYDLVVKKNLSNRDFPFLYDFLLEEQSKLDNMSSHRKLFEKRAEKTKPVPTKTPKTEDSRKSVICPYFARGTCKKGSRCDMKHLRPTKESSPSNSTKDSKPDEKKSSSPSTSSSTTSPKKAPYSKEQLAAPCLRTNCDKTDGHILGNCPKWTRCYKCDKPGHHSSYCSKK